MACKRLLPNPPATTAAVDTAWHGQLTLSGSTALPTLALATLALLLVLTFALALSGRLLVSATFAPRLTSHTQRCFHVRLDFCMMPMTQEWMSSHTSHTHTERGGGGGREGGREKVGDARHTATDATDSTRPDSAAVLLMLRSLFFDRGDQRVSHLRSPPTCCRRSSSIGARGPSQ